MLGLVVATERPDLEEQKNELIVSSAKMKAEVKALEELILKLLSECVGSPIDDQGLIQVGRFLNCVLAVLHCCCAPLCLITIFHIRLGRIIDVRHCARLSFLTSSPPSSSLDMAGSGRL
jgi:hypothetical protein